MAAWGCDGRQRGRVAGCMPCALAGVVLPVVNGDLQAGEDVVRETMLRGWLDAGELAPGHAGSWLHKVARSIAVSACHRGRRAGPSEVPLDENTAPAAGGGPGRMADAVLTAWARPSLSAGHREVIAELSCRGRPAAWVAALPGVPEGAAGSGCFYGRRVLRKVAGEQGIAGSYARARVSRLAACRGCRAGYGELVPAGAWPGRLAPAATLTSRSAGAMPAVRDWSDQ
jgi:DNA-directed RNA polymerase specialized sigma24 family protein